MNEFISKVSGKLQVGDFVIIITGNYFSFGFFISYKNKHFRYYTIMALLHYDRYLKERARKPYVDYINSRTEYRVAKYSVNNITTDSERIINLDEFYKAVEILKQLKIIDNDRTYD